MRFGATRKRVSLTAGAALAIMPVETARPARAVVEMDDPAVAQRGGREVSPRVWDRASGQRRFAGRCRSRVRRRPRAGRRHRRFPSDGHREQARHQGRLLVEPARQHGQLIQRACFARRSRHGAGDAAAGQQGDQKSARAEMHRGGAESLRDVKKDAPRSWRAAQGVGVFMARRHLQE